jgi:enoyl-CoA hydratase
MTAVLLTERIDAIALVTLNRAEVLNAVDAALRERLMATLAELGRDDAVEAIVLTGAGDRAFCAGQDLNEVASLDPEQVGNWLREVPRLYDAVRDLDKPCIAALNGVAAGAGLQLALHADAAIAHPEVEMGQPEIDAGLPSILGPFVMDHAVGWARARELSLTARQVDAKSCLRYGLVTEIVPRSEVLERGLGLARFLAAKPKVAVQLTKQRFRERTQVEWEATQAAFRRFGRQAFRSGEPQRVARDFLAARAARKKH